MLTLTPATTKWRTRTNINLPCRPNDEYTPETHSGFRQMWPYPGTKRGPNICHLIWACHHPSPWAWLPLGSPTTLPSAQEVEQSRVKHVSATQLSKQDRRDDTWTRLQVPPPSSDGAVLTSQRRCVKAGEGIQPVVVVCLPWSSSTS